jgi:hypothetical protein
VHPQIVPSLSGMRVGAIRIKPRSCQQRPSRLVHYVPQPGDASRVRLARHWRGPR